ncbi:MAG: glycosyltransferase [Bacteroidales bacterium]|nr:glycosyltransferase [Bacteroidales bacterium]
MISVLIPVYNFNIVDLVKTLHQQATNAQIPFEIIIVDDASNNKYKKINSAVNSLPYLVYHEEISNIGRSKIRNKLADLAKYNNFLFLDCDSYIKNPDFIRKYVNQVKDKNSVIYGGRIYNYSKPIEEKYRLHWLHGIKREQIPVEVRSSEPNRSFMTNNFLISREAFAKVRFNEKIRGYGHEDTLFGYDLLKNNITIKHIDNPLVHLGLESNEEFLRKTREGIKNLMRIMNINGNEKKLVHDITLLSYYKKLKDLHLDKICRYFYSKNEYLLRKNLLSTKPNLILFDLYKLGYLCSLKSEFK